MFSRLVFERKDEETRSLNHCASVCPRRTYSHLDTGEVEEPLEKRKWGNTSYKPASDREGTSDKEILLEILL